MSARVRKAINFDLAIKEAKIQRLIGTSAAKVDEALGDAKAKKKFLDIF